MKKLHQGRSKGSGSSSSSGGKGCSSKTDRDAENLVKYGFHGSQDLLESRKKQDFFIKPLYQNTLPDAPCDPKHILMPRDSHKFEVPSKEMRPFYQQLFNMECGVTVNLIGSALNRKSAQDSIHNSAIQLIPSPRDQILFEDDSIKGKENLYKRSQAHKMTVPWLRRTEYISSEPAKFKTQHGEKLEFRMDKAISKKLKSESKLEEFDYLKDRRARIKGIENSFEIVSVPILKHFSKPDVYAEEVLAVFPDSDLSSDHIVEIVFDTSPSSSTTVGKIDEETMKNALLLPMTMTSQQEEVGVEKVGYFIPSNASINDHRIGTDANTSTTEEYILAREYVFKQGVKLSMSVNEDTCVFLEKEGMMTYCEIKKRGNLNRSIKADSQSTIRSCKLIVTHPSLSKPKLEMEDI